MRPAAAGQRVFSVYMENQAMLVNFDIFAAAGARFTCKRPRTRGRGSAHEHPHAPAAYHADVYVVVTDGHLSVGLQKIVSAPQVRPTHAE